MQLYKKLAQLVGQYHRCKAPDANESQKSWALNVHESITQFCKSNLPSGSGFDCGTVIDLDKSTESKLVLETSYHHMNDGGFYDGWTEHTVTVKASLAFDFELHIGGRDRNDWKEYAYEVFNACLTDEVGE